jgi:AraC-like DNA-binding protein
VFPRTHVRIRHASAPPFLAGPSVVTLYNEGQEYQRGAVSAEGDRCDWIAVRPAILEDAVAAMAPSAPRGSKRLFPTSHVRSDSVVYLRQRCVFERLARAGQQPMDSLDLDETVLSLLELVMREACAAARHVPEPTAGQRALVAEARLLLVHHAGHRVGLADVASRLHCSVLHLCRTFRRVQGSTVHSYLMRLRLRLALERLADGGGDLTRIALDAGFCSHSHFTAAFRREFGTTPSLFVQRIRTPSRQPQ